MRKLLDFLYKRRRIALFLILELVSFWLIVSFNQRHNADFLNSSNTLAANVATASQDISDYFELEKINQQLVEENRLLQSQLNSEFNPPDSGRSYSENYSIISARVLSNSYQRSTNFLTISRGRADGVLPGMGIISPSGVVGQVKSSSENYASVYSLLHPQMLVSSILKKSNTKCTIQWDQVDFQQASLKFIPRHINLQIGDTITTSGFNSVFPPDVMLGIVSEKMLENHMTFYEAKVKLAVDFTSLHNVFAVVREAKVELDSLEVL